MKRFWIIISSSVLLLAGGFAAYRLGLMLGDSSNEPVPITATVMQPVDVSDVTLTTAAGDKQRMDDFGSDMTIAYFGFTRCPDVCPVTLGRLAQAYRDMNEPDNLQIVMITVDPTDTPEITHAYASAFHPDFMGLSGSNPEIANAIKRMFIGAAQTEDNLYNHTDAIIVLDGEGNMRMIYGKPDPSTFPRELEQVLEAGFDS